MPNDFADPNFLVGLKDPLEKPAPDTANRSFGTTVTDTLSSLGEGALSFARIETQAMRELSGDPNGIAAKVDRGVGEAQKWLKDQGTSPRAQALDTNKWFPGPGERSAWNEPVATMGRQVLGLVPSIAVGAATGGGGLGGLMLFGTQGASDALAQVRDYTDQTPTAELNKLEPFKAAMREFNGDEKAARDKLFKDSVDVWDVAVNFAANAAEFGAVMHAMTPAKKELVGFLSKNFIRRGAVGAVEGGAGGIAEGLASETTNQRSRVAMGLQPNVDVAEILSQGAETGMAMAPGVAGLHMARRGPRATPADADVKAVLPTQTQPTALNTGPPPGEQFGPPTEPYGPANMFGPHQPPGGGAPPAAGGPAGPAGPTSPPTGPGPAGPAPAPAPAAPAPPAAGAGVWQQATPQVQAATGATTMPGPAGPPEGPPTPSQATGQPAAPAPQVGQQAPITPGVNPTVLYVDPASFNDQALKVMSTKGGPAREVAFDEATGRWGVRLLEGPKAGQFHSKLYFDAETAPRPGLAPVQWGPGGVAYGDLIEEGVPTAEAPPVTGSPLAATQEPQVTGPAQVQRELGVPYSEAVQIAQQQGWVPPEGQAAAPAATTAAAPAVQQGLTPEEQAEYDRLTATPDGEAPLPQRDKRRRERQAARQERESQALTDEEIIERAKTETTKRMEAAAREGAAREAASGDTNVAGETIVQNPPAPTLGDTAAGTALEEARQRIFNKQGAAEAAQAETNAEVEALAPRGRIRLIPSEITRYKKNPTPEGWRQLRGRIMEAPPAEQERLIKRLGPQPVSAEDKARAQPKAGASPNQRAGVFKTAAGAARTVAARAADATGTMRTPPREQPRMGPASHDELVADLSERRGLPARQFFQLKFVIDTLETMRQMNAGRAPNERYPFPLWLQEKYNELGDKERRESINFLAEGTPYIKAALTLKNREKVNVTPDTKRAQRSDQLSATRILETREGRADAEQRAQEQRREARVDREAMQEKAQERLPARERLVRRRIRQRELHAENLIKQGTPETEARAQAAKTIPLLRTHEEGRGKRKRLVTERLPTAEELPPIVTEYVEEHIDREAGRAATEKTRDTRYRYRERAINRAFRNVMNRRGGQAAFVALLQRARGYERNERYPEINPADGKPDPRAWRAVASEYPKTPKILERRATLTNRLHDDTLDRFRDIEAAHMKRVAAYWKAKGDQLAAVNELQPMIDEMLKETAGLFNAVKNRLNITGRSTHFDMPTVKIEDTITKEGNAGKHLRITVGKGGAKSDMFKTMVELFKANEQLKVIRAATAQSRFRQADIMSTLEQTAEAAQEMRRYMRRMEQVADPVGLDLTSWLAGDFTGANERRRLVSDKITEAFNTVDTDSINQEGEFVDQLDNTAARNVFNQDADPMDQLATEEAAFAEGERQRNEKAAIERARSTQIDRLRALLAQAKDVNDPARIAKLEAIVAKAEAVLAKHNGNRRASPHYGEAPQSAREVTREVLDARAELDETDPDSPLISMPEHAAETMDRVKELISTGQAQVSSFVSPQFLDKLAHVLVDVPVIHTTSAVTEGKMLYQTGQNRIVMVNDVDAQDYAQGAVHEAVHAATEHLLETDLDFRTETGQLLDRARKAAIKQGVIKLVDKDGAQVPETLPRDLYGLTNRSEFLAEAISNERFRQFLNRVSTPGVSPIKEGPRTALNGLYRTIRDAWRKVLGTKRDADTALDTLFYDQSDVLGAAEKLVSRSVEQLRQEQRAPKLGFDRAMPPLGERFASAVKGAGPAALEKIKTTRDNIQRDRGLGLAIHSTYDLTTRAEPAFREKTSDVLDVAAMINRERGRMLQEEDQPVLLKVNKFLNALAPARRLEFEHFLIDETMHSAYADAALFTGKNRHIDQFSLADEQVRQQHADMQARWNGLAATEAEITNDAGKKEKVTAATIRDEAHKYFADRENQIREVVIKHTLERSDVLPDTLPAAQREAALNRMIGYIFPKPMSDTETAEFRKKEREALKNDYGIDLSNRGVRDQIADLRNEDALKRIEGPYFPLTRHGDYAVHGVFRIPTPDDASRYPEKIHWQTKRPIDDGTFLFDDIDDARDAIRQMSDTYGIAQIGGGEVYIDTRTGERVMEYTPRELEVDRELAELRKTPMPENRRLRKKEIEEGIKKGRPYVKKYEVRMQNRILEYHATEGEAQASINEWKARHPSVLDINGEPEDVRKGTGKENEQYVSQQMQRVIDRFEGSRSYRAQSAADQTALKHALTQAAAKSVMRRGVRARFATRNYVKGPSRDVMRNMADYSGSTAGYLAKMKHMTQVDETTRALRDYVEDQHGAKGHQARTRVTTELLDRLHEPTQSMVETPFSRAVDRILKFTMFDKLMGLGYFAVNATETSVIAGPLMAGKHSPTAVMREIATAYRMFGALKFAGYGVRDFWKAARNQRNYTDYQQKFLSAVRGKNDEAELIGLYQHLTKLGLFEATAGVEYQRLLMLSSQGKIDQAGDYLTNMFQGLNTSVENLSRFVTATAAYRLERKAGRTVNEAQQYARNMIYEAHGQYANFNAPELFNRNPIFKLALQFKKYPQRIAANYLRAITGSLGAVNALRKGQRPTAEQVTRARQFATMIAMQGLVAGVLGMPTEPFAIPINALYIAGIIPFNWDDVEAHGREKLANAVGPTAGELISHGVLRVLPWDVSGRLSQNSMLVYGSPGSTKVQDLQKSAFGIVAGAGGSYVAELVQAAQKGSEALRAYSDGATSVGNKKSVEAFKLAVPIRAVADIVDTIQRSSPEGMRTQSGRQMRPEYSVTEAIGALGGLRPTRESEQMEHRRVVERTKTVQAKERKEIIDHWAQSDASQRASQMPTIAKWNAGRPDEQLIKREDLLRALNVRTKAERQDPSKLGLSLDKRQLPILERTRGIYNY